MSRRWIVLLVPVCALWVCTAASGQSMESHYVSMDDGIELAVDVHFPKDFQTGEERPALLELTRYWRGAAHPKTGKPVGRLNPIDQGFLGSGYILVKVDVRGSGASFGVRHEEYGPREIQDGHAIVDWVSRQGWCDGNVGAYGISYSGTTAELLSACGHPALKAVIPGWSDFDVYNSPARTYGLYPAPLIDRWSEMVGWMDENNVERMGASVRPVDLERLPDAVADHQENPDVAQLVRMAEFRDQQYLRSRPFSECSSLHWKEQIESADVPMLVMASWLDAGTADGALLRFQHYSNRQFLVILASSHGGMFHASPYVVGEQPAPPVPSFDDQMQMRLAFFDHYLKDVDNEVPNWPPIRYFNMGEEAMHQSQVWPPEGLRPTEFFLAGGETLTKMTPAIGDEQDAYQVDFEVGTGNQNRWMTQMGGPVLRLDQRESMDARMLTYTSEPLTQDWQLTGCAEVHLWLSTNTADGAVFCYLEDVAPDGQSRYLSEGGVRLLHRRITIDPRLPHEILPRSFAKADAEQWVPGEPALVSFRMWPFSARIEAGHRVRVAFAGADQTFDQPTGEKDLRWTVYRDQDHPSRIVLPLIGNAQFGD